MKEIVFDLLDTYTEYDDIIAAIRSLHTSKEITDEEYDYILDNYSKFVEEFNLKRREKWKIII